MAEWISVETGVEQLNRTKTRKLKPRAAAIPPRHKKEKSK